MLFTSRFCNGHTRCSNINIMCVQSWNQSIKSYILSSTSLLIQLTDRTNQFNIKTCIILSFSSLNSNGTNVALVPTTSLLDVG